MTLLETVADALKNEQDPELALFLATAPLSTRRAAWLLAASVALHRPELVTILPRLWEDIDATNAVECLSTWPFVDRSKEGWRIADAFSSALVDDFRGADLEGWKRAHRLLAAHEMTGVTSESSDARKWFIEARIAYHVSAFDPSRSVKMLGEIFTHPPLFDPDGARSWLTALAARQELDLASQPRERAFFHGYTAYRSGLTETALRYLTPVFEGAASDPYAAFALYLVGISIGLREPERSFDLLERSIALSENLGLVEPEISARHSLVWNFFGYINARTPDSYTVARRVEQATTLAHINKERAEQSGSGLLMARSRWTMLVADWVMAVNIWSDQEVELRSAGLRAVVGLEQVREELLVNGDPRAAILTTRDAMSILGLLNLTDEAVDQCLAAIELAQWIEAPAALQRVAAEARNLVEQADGDQRRRIREMLPRLKVASQ